jgi:hypothetical protein
VINQDTPSTTLDHSSQDWLARYNLTAQRAPQVVEAIDSPDRSSIIVRIPASADRAQVQAVMDTARELVGKADAAEQAPQAAETEAAMRDWWARQRD